MLENIYRVDGKYPDPYQIEQELNSLQNDPVREKELKQSLSELADSGLSSHPLLGRFFVES
jgi:hypothetical protein